MRAWEDTSGDQGMIESSFWYAIEVIEPFFPREVAHVAGGARYHENTGDTRCDFNRTTARQRRACGWAKNSRLHLSSIVAAEMVAAEMLSEKVMRQRNNCYLGPAHETDRKNCCPQSSIGIKY